MFGIFNNVIESGLNLVEGEPKRDDVVNLIDTGMTIAAIAVAFDVSTDVIQNLLEADND